MIFEAEVIEVKARKTASVDKEIKIVFITDNEIALELQQYIANNTVTIQVDNNKGK